MTIHEIRNELAESFQSAYTEMYSLETALLTVQNDLLMAVDTKGTALLILLDLWAAFDTIDHGMLLPGLEYAFGLKDEALALIRSYLNGH